MKKLSDAQLNEISEIAVSAAEDFVLSRVPKKEIVDMDINLEINYSEKLDVDITVDITFDQLSSTDEEIAVDAANYAFKEIEKLL